MGPESERPRGLKHGVHALPAMGSQPGDKAKDPAGEHAGDTDTCQPDATPGTPSLISPLR